MYHEQDIVKIIELILNYYLLTNEKVANFTVIHN